MHEEIEVEALEEVRGRAGEKRDHAKKTSDQDLSRRVRSCLRRRGGRRGQVHRDRYLGEHVGKKGS